MTNKIVGYARVSKEEQRTDGQLLALQSYPCDEIYEEKISGAKFDRPEFLKLLQTLQPGDTLVVYRLDRLSRSTQDLLKIVEHLNTQQVALRSIKEAIDTRSDMGKLFLTILGAIAEFERNSLITRTKAGLQAAKARGAKLGRESKHTPDEMKEALELMEKQKLSVDQVAGLLKLHRSSVYRYLKMKEARK